jgi:hypothetical protein
MAGYAPTGAAKKLGVKAGGTLLLAHAPQGWGIADLPPGVESATWERDSSTDGAGTSVLLAFYREAADYLAEIEAIAAAIFPATAVWIAWPRRAGGHESDITDSVVRDAALALGLVDNKVAAIDEDWSGLRLVWRKELRTKR